MAVNSGCSADYQHEARLCRWLNANMGNIWLELTANIWHTMCLDLIGTLDVYSILTLYESMCSSISKQGAQLLFSRQWKLLAPAMIC